MVVLAMLATTTPHAQDSTTDDAAKMPMRAIRVGELLLIALQASGIV